jgi:hypothetical protein
MEAATILVVVLIIGVSALLVTRAETKHGRRES